MGTAPHLRLLCRWERIFSLLIDKDISHVVYTLKDNSGTIELYVNATSKAYTYTDELANVYEIPAYSCVKVN